MKFAWIPLGVGHRSGLTANWFKRPRSSGQQDLVGCKQSSSTRFKGVLRGLSIREDSDVSSSDSAFNYSTLHPLFGITLPSGSPYKQVSNY